MKYYTVLELETDYKPLLWIKPEIHNDLWFWNYNLQKWIKIKNWNNWNKLYFEGNYDKIEDYLPNTLPSPVISKKIKEDMAESWITGVQYLPIKLEQIDNSNNIIDWYYVLNILNRENENIINPDLSKIAPFWYAWVWFYKDKLTWYDIFRINWDEQIKFFISEKVKKIIDKYVHSVSFEDVEIS